MAELQKKPNSIWLKVIMVVVVLATVVMIIFSIGDINQILDNLSNIHVGYYVLALVASISGFLLMSLSSQIVLRSLDKSVRYFDGFLIQTSEYFFNGITPFSSGAQPFQLYFYNKQGLEVNKGTSVLVVNFILYQIALTIISTIGIAYFFNDITQALGDYTAFIFVGYIINVVIIILLFLLAYIKRIYRFFEGIFGFFEKFKFTQKRAAKLKTKTAVFISEFQGGVRILFSKKRVFILALSTKIIALMLYFGVIILVYLALGLNATDTFGTREAFYIIVSAMIAITTMIYVPLPGASGGTEWAFTTLILTVVTNIDVAMSLMLLWRFATYYLSIIFGLTGFLWLRHREKKGSRNA